MHATHELIEFSNVGGPLLVGTWGYVCYTGSDAVTSALSGYLGTAPVGGTITGAFRQFNLPTSRAPGDWPEPYRHTVRF